MNMNCFDWEMSLMNLVDVCCYNVREVLGWYLMM